MGGYVALAFAEFFPQKVTKLVLINSTSLDDSNERKQNRDRAIQMAKKDYTSFVSLSISNLFSEENRNILITEIEKVKLIALKTPLQGIIAAQEGMKIRKNRLEIFRKINIPKLLILSEKDPILNYSENRKQVEESTIQLATLPDGHMSFIENRKELIAVLDAFL
jgi:pimeloyl-ACP methyl ester carboxylesterase